MARKTVLCYGDSNTWGRDPHSVARLPEAVRWPSVLAATLGPGVLVVPEGLNGRTTVWDDPIEEGRSGKLHLRPCLLTHHPLDVVVLMLGTNDLKQRFSVTPMDIGRSIGLLIDKIQQSGAGPDDATPPQVLVICPPPLARMSAFAEMFAGGAEKSRRLAPFYREHAGLRGCRFLDAGEIVKTSDGDGVHLDAEAHQTLGNAVAEIAAEMLAQERAATRPA